MQIAHSKGLIRLERTLARDIRGFLLQAESDIFERIVAKGFLNKPISRTTRRQLNNLITRVNKDLSKVDKKMIKMLRKSIDEIALYEQGFQKRLIKQSAPFPVNLKDASSSIILSSVYSRPTQGRTLATWMSNYSTSKRQNVDQAIRQAFYQGEGVAGARRRLLTSPNSQIVRSGRGAEAIARTGLNHSATQAKALFYENNGIKKGRYTAVLDGRTTIVCSSQDGMIDTISNLQSWIPAHFACRSTIVPVIENQNVLGERQTITDTRTKRKIQRSFKGDPKKRQAWLRENVGKTPAKTTYNQWLRGQSAKFQDQYLGKQKGALFRRGKLNLEDFIDSKTRLPLSLKQLRTLEPKAFQLANL